MSAEPPEDLPEDQRAFWKRNAPRAIELGTLNLDTEESFRLLCEMDAERREVRETIGRDGRTQIKVTVDGAGQEHQEQKPHPLKSDYRQLCKSVEGLLARFMLAPFGKPPQPTRKPRAQGSPWSQVASR